MKIKFLTILFDFHHHSNDRKKCQMTIKLQKIICFTENIFKGIVLIDLVP